MQWFLQAGHYPETTARRVIKRENLSVRFTDQDNLTALASLERFQFDPEIITHEHKKRARIGKFRWFIEKTQTRAVSTYSQLTKDC